MDFLEVHQGTSPVVLSLPHTGLHVPGDVRNALNETGRALSDTDWHLHQLYDGLLADVTTVRTTVHRYVIDVNRDPSGVSLYPGQNTTGLVPLTDFDGRPLWSTPPDPAETERRRLAFHAPYHAALRAELDRVRALHGVVVLYDCHSIRSVIPHLFDGVLPDLNIGDNFGATCAPRVTQEVEAVCRAAQGFSMVLNGRFRGGWTTRHNGRPEGPCQAIQMELAQSRYLRDEAAPWTYDAEKAAPLRAVLSEILHRLADTALSGALTPPAAEERPR